MKTYFVSFYKDQPERIAIRCDFAVLAVSKQQARLIAEKEMASLKGYRLQGVN